MRIILISRDADFSKLCRDILNEFEGLDWHFSQSSARDCPPDADLYIWDDPTQAGFPPELDRSFSKHLFVIDRNEAGRFHQHVASAGAAVLLKPVTRGCLSAFLRLAASTHEERASAAESLRADRDEILQCLIQANLQLQEYDQDRTKFLARAVHDFRAPLTATNGYCGLLLGEALGPLAGEQKEVLRRMQHSLKRLSQSAFAMFELSVGRQVKMRSDLRKGDIRECIEQALHEIGPFADSKRIAVSVDLTPETCPLFLERGRSSRC